MITLNNRFAFHLTAAYMTQKVAYSCVVLTVKIYMCVWHHGMKRYEYSSFLNVSLCCWPRRFDVFGSLFSTSLNRRTDRLGESNIRITFFLTNTQELHYVHALLLILFPRYFLSLASLFYSKISIYEIK
jgi:hypothetical protein